MKIKKSITKKKKNILVINDNPLNEFNNSIENNIFQHAENNNINIISVTGNNLLSLFDIINIKNTNGIIIIFDNKNSSDNTKIINDFNHDNPQIPILTINKEIEGIPGIIIDHKSGIKKLLSHFTLKHDLKNIAFIYNSKNIFYEIYKNLLIEMNINYKQDLFVSYESNLHPVQNTIKLLLEKNIKIDAVICENTDYIISFLYKNTEIKNSISFAGISPINTDLFPESKLITRLSYPLNEIAEYSLSVLLSNMNGKKKENTVIFPINLEIGNSCKCQTVNKTVNNEQKIKEFFSAEKSNIFIIDDNEEIRNTLHTSLERTYNVFIAENGDEAIKKINNIPVPDIIISDIMMDKMDGYELFQKLSLDKRYKHIPFIFISVKDSVDEKLRGLKKGAVDYITKPFLIEEIQAKIKSIIKHNKKQQKNNLSKIHDKISHLLTDIKNESIKNKKTVMFSNICRQHDLTKREQEIMNLLLQGLLNKEISFILKIKKRTVDFHVQNIYNKFNVNSRIQLVNFFNK